MSTSVVMPRPTRIPVPRDERWTPDRWFFTSMAVSAALVVFGGFAPTYYLKGLSGTPALSPLVHVHGIVFTTWIALFLTQTALISARRADLHRFIGMAGGVLAVAMLVVGTAVAIAAAKRPNALNEALGLPPPLVFLVIPLGDLAAFAVLVGGGLYNRRNREVHKRLMLLATIAILNAGFGRLVFPGGVLAFLRLPVSPLTLIGLTGLFVAACLFYDRMTRGRVHAAFLWGGVFILTCQIVRLFVAGTTAWLTFAHWLTS
jgi:hypothetical protein